MNDGSLSSSPLAVKCPSCPFERMMGDTCNKSWSATFMIPKRVQPHASSRRPFDVRRDDWNLALLPQVQGPLFLSFARRFAQDLGAR